MDAKQIVDKMLLADTFSQWLGIKMIEVGVGNCKLSVEVRSDMLNGFGIAHGGITYCMADSALAFASNSLGRHSVSIETSISHIQKVSLGDKLIASAKQISSSNKIGFYEIPVHNQNGILVALFKGTVYIKDKVWE